MATTPDLFAGRKNRMKAVQNLEEPDRVPLVPKMNFFYGSGYGISTYETMSDLRNILPGLKAYLNEFKPDAVWGPAQYPIPALEALGSNFIHWPGYDNKIPLDASFQILDDTFIEPEEFEDFCFDPTHFIVTKWMPRRNKNLAGLARLNFQNPIEYGFFSELFAFNDPEVKSALEALMLSGKGVKNWMEGNGLFIKTCIDMGYPLGPTVGQTCAFDMFADNFRGLVDTICDVRERPEQLLEVLDVMTKLCVRNALGGVKANNLDYLFIPLHMGVDEFMSPADYAKFYWPGLKALMTAAINEGITPYVFCEGNYNTRLEQLCDVPKGKVIYMFEKVDMKKAKETVGKVACICGNIPTLTLMTGTVEETENATRKLLDTCAPGGGFIMDASIVIDSCKKENLHAMFDTVHKYGCY